MGEEKQLQPVLWEKAVLRKHPLSTRPWRRKVVMKDHKKAARLIAKVRGQIELALDLTFRTNPTSRIELLKSLAVLAQPLRDKLQAAVLRKDYSALSLEELTGLAEASTLVSAMKKSEAKQEVDLSVWERVVTVITRDQQSRIGYV